MNSGHGRSQLAILGAGVGVTLTATAAGILLDPELEASFRRWTAGLYAAVLLAGLGLLAGRRAWWPRLVAVLEAQDEALEERRGPGAGWAIFFVVAAGLFAELMIVRWHTSSFQVFGFFKNVSLLACFLGLGVGYALPPSRRSYAPLIVPALAAQFVVLHPLRFTRLQFVLSNPIDERMAMGLRTAETLSALLVSYGFVLGTFFVTSLTMVPLGQLAARIMSFQDKLPAYGWNLAGSLAGCVAFAAIGLLWSPPELWFVLAALPLLVFLRQRSAVSWGVASLVVAVAVLSYPRSVPDIDIYSPYQRITFQPRAGGQTSIRVNDFYFQHMLDLREGSRSPNAGENDALFYDLPYTLVPEPDRVLVVGSGTGNDVAAAVRHGAKRVDAVEIDPVIVDIGRRLHPEQPYSHPGVTVHVTDARGFVRATPHRYDLIVYGALDAHTALSGLSSVRLDSFVYTVEAVRESASKLTDRGLVCLSFAVMGPIQAKKIYEMVVQAFDGQAPHVLFVPPHGRMTFVGGPGMASLQLPRPLARGSLSQQLAAMKDEVDVSTDDWPFLYMVRRQYPTSYLLMNALLFAMGLLLVRGTLGSSRGWFDPAFFFLGAGFMLVETKAITELGLVFGNTWLLVSIAIVGVLIMAFLANLLVIKGRAPSPRVGFALLLLSLVAGFLFSGTLARDLDPTVARLVVPALLTAPVLFAGLVFSGTLSERGTVRTALASNLLGALLGGLLEYNAMFFGYRSLYLLAIVMYLLALSSVLRTSPQPRGSG